MSHADEVFRRAREVQEEGQGVVARPPRNTFVPPVAPGHQIVPQAKPVVALPSAPQQVDVKVNHPSIQQSITKSSAVDRSKGFTIVVIPLAAVLGLIVVLVTAGFTSEFWTFTSLQIFFVSFGLFWLAGWFITLAVSAEGVSFHSNLRQWGMIDREHIESIEYRRWQVGREPWWQERLRQNYYTVVMFTKSALIIGFVLFLMFMVVWITWELNQ